MLHDLLIVEDKLEEAELARETAKKSGFETIVIAHTLQEAQQYLPEAQRVASDLFFPAGDISTQQYIQRFLPIYEAYRERRFKHISKDSPVLAAVESCAKLFGITPEDYVENFMAKMNTPACVLKAARDSLVGREDAERYKRFLKIEQDIKEGRNLPLGIIALERAAERNLPRVLVTSTNHHNDAFEPVSSLIGTKYFDTLVNRNKDWESAMRYLINLGEK